MPSDNYKDPLDNETLNGFIKGDRSTLTIQKLKDFLKDPELSKSKRIAIESAIKDVGTADRVRNYEEAPLIERYRRTTLRWIEQHMTKIQYGGGSSILAGLIYMVYAGIIPLPQQNNLESIPQVLSEEIIEVKDSIEDLKIGTEKHDDKGYHEQAEKDIRELKIAVNDNSYEIKENGQRIIARHDKAISKIGSVEDSQKAMNDTLKKMFDGMKESSKEQRNFQMQMLEQTTELATEVKNLYRDVDNLEDRRGRSSSGR